MQDVVNLDEVLLRRLADVVRRELNIFEPVYIAVVQIDLARAVRAVERDDRHAQAEPGEPVDREPRQRPRRDHRTPPRVNLLAGRPPAG